MKKLYFSIFLIQLITINFIVAQVDPHFSQYYSYTLFLNPALAGNINGDFRITAVHRNQYIAGNSPYKTTGVTIDLNAPKNFGFGFSIANQVASEGAYHHLNANLTLSYKVFLDQYHILGAGFQIGVINRYINPSKFEFGNQYNPLIGFDPSMVSNERFNNNKSLAMDLSIGLIYMDIDPNKMWNPFIGLSVFHINKPPETFLNPSYNQFIPSRYVIHCGAKIVANDGLDITPNFIFMKQGDATEFSGGLMANINVVPSTNLLVGGTYRNQDAIVPTIGLEYNSLRVGLSYDVSTSAYKAATNYQGGFELSVGLRFSKSETLTNISCPKF